MLAYKNDCQPLSLAPVIFSNREDIDEDVLAFFL